MPGRRKKHKHSFFFFFSLFCLCNADTMFESNLNMKLLSKQNFQLHIFRLWVWLLRQWFTVKGHLNKDSKNIPCESITYLPLLTFGNSACWQFFSFCFVFLFKQTISAATDHYWSEFLKTDWTHQFFFTFWQQTFVFRLCKAWSNAVSWLIDRIIASHLLQNVCSLKKENPCFQMDPNLTHLQNVCFFTKKKKKSWFSIGT